MPTETAIISDQGIPFVVHVTTLQERKRHAKSEQIEKPFNPFLPPDPDLLVCEIPPHHIGVLNKFNVLRHHLLIVTRGYEPQEKLLDDADFVALTTCMSGMDGLGFYNGGTVAGASQSHKHIQLVPLPLGTGPMATPLDSIVDGSAVVGTQTQISPFNFAHVLIPLDGSRLGPHRADELHQHYRHACSALGIHNETQPYNLLVTRRWMLLVPRSHEFWREVSINALAFAGSLLVRNRTELDQLKETGPLAILRSVVDDDSPP